MKKQDIIRIINEEIGFALEEQENQLYKVVDDKGEVIYPDKSSDIKGLIKRIATKLAAKNPDVWSVEEINEMIDPIYNSNLPEIVASLITSGVTIKQIIKFILKKYKNKKNGDKLDKDTIVEIIKKAKSQIKGNVNEKEYTVEYYRTYKDGEEEFDEIKVTATSETEAIEKAKKEAPRATRSFKIIK